MGCIRRIMSPVHLAHMRFIEHTELYVFAQDRDFSFNIFDEAARCPLSPLYFVFSVKRIWKLEKRCVTAAPKLETEENPKTDLNMSIRDIVARLAYAYIPRVHRNKWSVPQSMDAGEQSHLQLRRPSNAGKEWP